MTESGFPQLATPPRTVPYDTVLQLLFRGTQPRLARGGWALLSIGMAILFVVSFFADVPTVLFFLSPTRTVDAHITSQQRTNLRSGGKTVHRTEYTYDLEGFEYYGIAYAFDDKDASWGSLFHSAKADYIVAHPSISRLRGYRRAPICPAFEFLLLVFPIAGVWLLAKQMASGLRAIGLLRTGSLVRGVRDGDQHVGVMRRHSHYPMYAERYRFTAESGQDYFVCAAAGEQMGDGTWAPVLYDPSRPSSAIVPVSGPMYLDINESGQLVPLRPSDSVIALIGPFVLIATCLIFADPFPVPQTAESTVLRIRPDNEPRDGAPSPNDCKACGAAVCRYPAQRRGGSQEAARPRRTSGCT